MDRVAKILLVDDHPLIREGLAGRIAAQPDMTVCGEAADITGALAQIIATDPDLVIVDLALKNGHGLDLIKAIRARTDKIKILVISAYEESLFAERTLRAGAQGYVNKQALQEKAIEAVRSVLSGRRYLSLELTEQLVGHAIGPNVKAQHGVESLSDRELQIFELIGRGNSTSIIAGQLHLSVHTIESHREKIRAKLKLLNGTELMRRAVQWVLENG